MVGAVCIAGVAAFLDAGAIPVIPQPSTVASNLIFLAGATPLVLLAWRAARTYLLTRRVSDLIVTEGVVWLIAAQYGLLTFTMADGAWWMAHLLEFTGIGMVGIPAALDLRHAVASFARSSAISVPSISWSTKRHFLAAASGPFWSGWERRIARPRATLAGSPPWPSRSESVSAFRKAAFDSWPSAACCTMSASCRCPTRSSTSPAGCAQASHQSQNPSRYRGCPKPGECGDLR